MIWVAALVACTGTVFVTFNQYAHFLSPDKTSIGHWSDYGSAFLVGIENLTSRSNLRTIAKSVGLLSIPAALIAIIITGWQRKWQLTMFWLIMAALPTVLFWSMISGNSARHNLIPGVFVYVLLALPFATRLRRDWVYILAIIFVVNYLYYPPSDNTVSPSGGLLGNARLLRDRAEEYHTLGETIAHSAHQKMAVIGIGYRQPYFIFETLRSPQLSYNSHKTNLKKVQTLEMKNDNPEPNLPLDI